MEERIKCRRNRKMFRRGFLTLFLLCFLQTLRAYAGDSLPSGTYMASDMIYTETNLSFSGSNDTTIILDQDLTESSITMYDDMNASLIIKNKPGDPPHTLTLTRSGTVLEALSLQISGIRLVISQDLEKDAVALKANSSISISDSYIQADLKARWGAFYAMTGDIVVDGCDVKLKNNISSDTNIGGFYVNGGQIRISDTTVDMDMTNAVFFSESKPITFTNVKGSVSASSINSPAVQSGKTVLMENCKLKLSSHNTGILSRGTSVKNSSLEIMSSGTGLQVENHGGALSAEDSDIKIYGGQCGILHQSADEETRISGGTLNIDVSHSAINSRGPLSLKNVTGTIAGTRGLLSGSSILIDGCELKIDGEQAAIAAKEKIALSDNIGFLSPHGAKFVLGTPEETELNIVAASDGTWAKNVVIGKKKLSHSVCTVSAIPNQTYTGSEIRPAFTASWNQTDLKQGTDFTVSYSNNINAGTARVTLAGTGNYSGSRSVTFTIVPASITDVSAADQTYTGSALKPVPAVKAGSLTVPSSGYTVSYKNNLKAGTATLTVTGKGNFKGTKSGTFTIKAGVKPEEEKKYGVDGTAVGKGASARIAEKAVLAMTSDEAPAGSRFRLLQLVSKKQTANSVTISWKKVTGAKKYVVYGNACGKTNRMKKLRTTTARKAVFKKVAGKKVKSGKYYKFLVVALDGSNHVVTTSKTIHAVTKGGIYGNDKAVRTAAKKNRITLKKNGKFRLKAKPVPQSKKLKVSRHRKISYESSNKKVAVVNRNGVITGKGKGTCYVYAYAQNGIFRKTKVTVK